MTVLLCKAHPNGEQSGQGIVVMAMNRQGHNKWTDYQLLGHFYFKKKTK